MFGLPGTCAKCRQPIPPQELVMRCQDKTFHVNCFACTRCQVQLRPGDRACLVNCDLFCEHEFANLFASSTSPSPNLLRQSPGSKRQASVISGDPDLPPVKLIDYRRHDNDVLPVTSSSTTTYDTSVFNFNGLSPTPPSGGPIRPSQFSNDDPVFASSLGTNGYLLPPARTLITGHHQHPVESAQQPPSAVPAPTQPSRKRVKKADSRAVAAAAANSNPVRVC